MLSELNPHVRDKDISMNAETHTYTVKGKAYRGSVSTFLKLFFSKFDEKLAITNILKSKNINNPTYEYYGMNYEQIKKHWENGKNLGTELHSYIEDYFNGKERINNTVEYSYFKNFIRDYPNFIPYRTEFMIYHEQLRLVGCVDMLCIKPNGHFTLLDWKRSKRIDAYSFNNKCSTFPGLTHIPDCNFYHYTFQLNIYKYILETCYDMIIDEMYMVVFHPNNTNYKIYVINTLQNEMNIIMDYRSKNLT